jgi:hypothetical protein
MRGDDELALSVLGWVGLGWVGLGWVGLGWVGLGNDNLYLLNILPEIDF